MAVRRSNLVRFLDTFSSDFTATLLRFSRHCFARRSVEVPGQDEHVFIVVNVDVHGHIYAGENGSLLLHTWQPAMVLILRLTFL